MKSISPQKDLALPSTEMQSASLESSLRPGAKNLLIHLRKLSRTPLTYPYSMITSPG